jgi:hypothetical protein
MDNNFSSTPVVSNPEILQWPNELDALHADPGHHKLLFENDRVRVLDTLILPGDITELHTHCFPAALYIISWSDFIRYDEQGNILLNSSSLPIIPSPCSSMWTTALGAHRLRNIGTAPLHIISTELKS